jgi:hypothetical protein
MNTTALQELCKSHGFTLELHRLPSSSKDSYFVILVPTSTGVLDLNSRKAEIDSLRRELMELCPSIEYVTIQLGAD